MNTSLEYRKQRMHELAKCWHMTLRNPYYSDWQIPNLLLDDFREAVGRYIAKALHFPYCSEEDQLISLIDSRKSDRTNVTPNGAVVPKLEYALEYNQVLKCWCDIARALTAAAPWKLKKFRLTPNIRIKFAEELKDNTGRGLNTALPHSDAWVEGPWGMNCHVPLFGDVKRDYLQFFRLITESDYTDDFLKSSASYKDMQWVMPYYENDSLIPNKNHICLSDYVLIHRTLRLPSAGTRVSVDTTIMVGDHEIIQDREIEYFDSIPRIGENLFVKCHRREMSEISDKRTSFSHYTTGAVTFVTI
ncbi:hypothetical protein MCEMSE6_02934 [Oxalobacteraceae bacterium]